MPSVEREVRDSLFDNDEGQLEEGEDVCENGEHCFQDR